MKILLKNSKVLDKNSPFHQQDVDVLIEDGEIKEIAKKISKQADKVFDNCLLLPGLCDLNAHFTEPGTEHRETLFSGTRSAAFSGFTDVCVLPNTEPVIESKSDVGFIKNGSANGVRLHPIGAISEGCKGENLTEILDLENAGAVAFSDGLNPIYNTELLLKALQYVQKFDGLIINHPKDIHLSQFAQMHEGKVSTILGMNGEPSISEVISIKRDLDILSYAGGRLHFSQISTAEGVELIRKAKKDGLEVTCDVAIHQLLFTDANLTDYDTNYKVDPPFRSEKDRKALIKGVQTGVVDAIVSAHNPQDPESKDLEFDLSSAGICSLPTFISNLLQLSSSIDLEILIDKVSNSPRSILKLDNVVIDQGNKAQMAIVSTDADWVFNSSVNPSRSINSPQYNQTLKGKCLAVINGEELIINP